MARGTDRDPLFIKSTVHKSRGRPRGSGFCSARPQIVSTILGTLDLILSKRIVCLFSCSNVDFSWLINQRSYFVLPSFQYMQNRCILFDLFFFAIAASTAVPTTSTTKFTMISSEMTTTSTQTSNNVIFFVKSKGYPLPPLLSLFSCTICTKREEILL